MGQRCMMSFFLRKTWHKPLNSHFWGNKTQNAISKKLNTTVWLQKPQLKREVIMHTRPSHPPISVVLDGDQYKQKETTQDKEAAVTSLKRFWRDVILICCF